MSSPNPTPPWQFWQSHRYQQPSAQQFDQRYSQTPSRGYSQYGYYASQSTPYVQPHHGNASSIPVIAELPAPLPPAPPTTTSEEQLKQDELFAHKMQQLEVEQTRRKSCSVDSQHQRPVSMMPLSQQQLPTPTIFHQQSTQSLRPHSHSLSTFTDRPPVSMVPSSISQAPLPSLTHQRSAQSIRPHSQSLGASVGRSPFDSSLDRARFSSLPEVVVDLPPACGWYGPKSLEPDLPIPVLQDEQSAHRPSVALEHTSLPAYLEQFRQTPYPPQWQPPPILSTFYAYPGPRTSRSTWLDIQDSCAWRTIRPREYARDPSPPAHSFKFKFKSNTSMFRSQKFSWVMSCPEQPADATKKIAKAHQTTWTYDLRIDPKTNLRISEILSHLGSKVKTILTTYIHALNYDSLRFLGPDGRAYMWVSSTKLSSVNGSRYDTLRHALFASVGHNPDPLYGHIVADHCFWDGHVDSTGSARVPDEALYIRSQNIDPALVVATLQIIKDWEKLTMREEKRNNPKGFQTSENEARECELGRRSYWRGDE